MKKVINTTGYGTAEGFADQITLPNGNIFHTGVNSLMSMEARKKGYAVKTINYFGACIAQNLDERAHKGFPIQINEVSVADFIDKFASQDELDGLLKTFFPKGFKHSVGD